ncbi:unnamed protein product [Ixodes persulcatus]
MLEGLAAWVLNTYVGGYVENLNTHQLSIGLLRGEVELENLPLKKDAFRQLLLPLEIKAGFIGKLSLKIPVTRLRSEPWLITIEQLYIVVGPVSLNEYDEEREDQVLQNAKLSKLDAMEAKWKASNESKQEPSYYAYSYAAWLTCGTSVMSNIIKNLQANVHLRYEDDFTDAQNPFACGITIQALSSQGASGKEHDAPQEAAEEIAHQSLQLNGCAVYWDTDVTMLGGLDIMAMADAMKKQQTHGLTTTKLLRPHSYLLATTSAQAQISRNCSAQPLRSRSKPRLVCDLQLDKFSITLNEEQYRQMVFSLRELERIDLSWKYRRWRPTVSVQGNAKEWWRFAMQAHVSHITKRHSQATWEFACLRAKQVKTYVDIYYSHLTKPETLGTEKQKEKNFLEQQLEFETLLSLRELVIQKVRREQQSSWVPGSRGQGLLQYWFPGWTGWYSGGTAEETSKDAAAEDDASDFDDASSISTTLTSQIEEEILDVLDSVDRDTFLMRDTVLARVSFSLSQCSFTLVGLRPAGESKDPSGMQPLVELRFADVTLDVESRPRLGSFLFAARLGSLHFLDRTAENPLYPYVLAPHSVESLHVFPKVSVGDGTKPQSSIFKFLPFSTSSSPFGIPLPSGDKMDCPSTPLFELTYERNPLGSSADHSLVVKTQSLDVVYNPSTIRTVKRFLTLWNYEGSTCPRSGEALNLSAAARSRYEMFKKHTKDELRHRWDLMLEGKESSIARWDVQMDICAPQIIVPESFSEGSSTVVRTFTTLPVSCAHLSGHFGMTYFHKFGMFSFHRGDFKTPCSSPPELVQLEETSPKKPDGSFLMKECSVINDNFVISSGQGSAFTESDILDRMYKRYTLNLQDMQVLVGTSKESWKFAQSKGTSRMHVLDRFSICIQVERRLLATDDPHWPSVILSMKLPRLTAHVNEQKASKLLLCARGKGEEDKHLSFRDATHDDARAVEVQNAKEKEPHELSLLLLAQCSIEQMCLEVQSRGKCIAELQVTGVQATFSKRPLDSSFTMSVHGLLLVDALQTYGPDFELLVASHKHVSMDSRSGSIRDSDPNSPTSPSSPPVPALCSPPLQTIAARRSSDQTLAPSNLSCLIYALISFKPLHITALSKFVISLFLAVLMDRHCTSPISVLDSHELDALITVEVTMVNIPSSDGNSSGEQVFIAAVQFNNLDVIANQETIVELVSFAHCLKASDTSRPCPTGCSGTSVQASQSQISSMQLTFDFHRFNVLLLRSVSRKGSVSGQKVATATISGAKIQASIGSSLEIQGTLGGLQVCDLISEKTLHRRIVSMGSDPHLIQETHDLLSRRLYRATMPSGDSSDSQKAFDVDYSGLAPLSALFTEHQRTAKKQYPRKQALRPRRSDADPTGGPGTGGSLECLDVLVRTASVCYIHSPQLLHELTSCAVEFKHCMAVLAKSIRDAATEVALGIVNMPSQPLGMSLHVELDILLQTPVIVLPCSASSRNVLVAHLGRISVQNTDSSLLQSPQFAFNSCDPYKADVFFVQFRDVNLFSLNIDDNLGASAKAAPGAVAGFSPDLLPVVDLYSCRAHGRPILHDTVIEFTVRCQIVYKYKKKLFAIQSKLVITDLDFDQDSGLLEEEYVVSGTVINSLKFALTKHQYELMLQSINNIAYCDDLHINEDSSGEPTHFSSSWEDLVSKDILSLPERSQQVSKNAAEEMAQGSSKFVCCHVSFVLPEFVINLCSDMCEDRQDLVALSFQEFVVNYEKDSLFETNIQMALKGVLMEDLMEHSESSHRCLIRSTVPESQLESSRTAPPKSDFISVSCPDMTYHMPTLAAHPSLPDRLCTENVFQAHLKRSRGAEERKKNLRGDRGSVSAYPFTPPPSPSGCVSSPQLAQEDSLMHINVCLIDRRSPHFASRHNRVNKTITVDLNSLETVINSQTWVMVLDFLGISASPSDEPDVSCKRDVAAKEDTELAQELEHETSNTELEVNIHNFTVTLNKPTHELARASISGFSSHMSLKDQDIVLRASLAKISVLDLTPHGQLYPERFVTAGREALHFDIFKYGAPDPDLAREFDIKVKCEMSSVQMVHTQRFFTEVTDFFADFSELQMLLRAATAGSKVNLEACHAQRVQVEVTAGSPVIVIPQSHSRPDVLVANLGNLTVSTHFRFVGEEDITLSSSASSSGSPPHQGRWQIDTQNLGSVCSSSSNDAIGKYRTPCLLQVMHMELADMDLYSGVRLSTSEAAALGCSARSLGVQFPSFLIKKSGGSLLKRTFMLHLQVEKNLDSAFNHSVPDWTVQGSFSSVHFTLDRSQYRLVHGILNHNLGERVERTSASGSLLVELFPEQKSWTYLAIYMDLKNVTLELVRSHPRPNCANSEAALAKIDLIRSRLTLERYSDQSHDIDLVSHEIRVSDTRFKDAPVNNRPNVFTNILQPTKNVAQGKVLQAEVHYRVTHNLGRFTVLLNNMRVMAVFSWITELSDFLSVDTSSQDAATLRVWSMRRHEPSCALLPASCVLHRAHGSTSHLPAPLETIVPLELKLNMTDTEIVVVEDTAAWDTNAVILKSTAVLTYHWEHVERPLSCNLQNLEVFSCILGVEEDTALSIVDPISVYIDLVERPSTSHAPGTSHILQASWCCQKRVGTMNMNLRLSYHDVKLFLKILDSIPKQSFFGGTKGQRKYLLFVFQTVQVDSLREMGFTYEDCIRGLEECKGNVDEAAIWLTQNAAIDLLASPAEQNPTKRSVDVSAVELKVSYFCLCIIDDCMDADVPLLEINLRETYISQELASTFGGESKFFFSTGYYNRALSGWEPIIEPWRCNCQWDAAFDKQGLTKFSFRVNAEDVLKVNITTALLDLYQRVKQSWTADLYELFSKEKSPDGRDPNAHGEVAVRRRSPFVPFAIKNDLGLSFTFATLVSATYCGKEEPVPPRLDWTGVGPGQVVPFTFQGREKLRHQDSHELRMHQLILRVDGYQQLDPVSVDRVGVYFKYAMPKEHQLRSSAITRVVFSVTLDGNARKLITVRSALVIKNRVEVPVDLKLEIPGVKPHQMHLLPKSTAALPLPFVYSEVWVRPALGMMSYSSLQCLPLTQGSSSYSASCCPIRSDLPLFRRGFNSNLQIHRFSVAVKRENYPDKENVPSTVPAHTITLLPPISVHNLLPYDLAYAINENQCKGVISPRKNCSLHEVNTEQYVIINFSLEYFQQCTSLVIPPESGSFTTRLETRDTEGRLLLLHARVAVLRGRSLKVFISAPYWIINRSGLPLIFKQEGTNSESAGQFPEHEQARSVAPLLFSFADSEASMMCSMRLGTELHPRSFPQWCTSFSLEKGTRVRRLMVSPKDARPDCGRTFLLDVQPPPRAHCLSSCFVCACTPEAHEMLKHCRSWEARA